MTEHEVIIEFELKDDKITNNTDKIVEAFKQIKSSFSGNVDKPISKGLAEMAEKSKKASKPLKEIKKNTKGAALSMAALAGQAAIYTKKAIELADKSAKFIGTQTKFNAIFDKTNGELEKAQQWVDNYSKSLMLDNKVVMDTVSNFKLFANTLGLSNEKAKEITFNMTQLAHDMAAVAGVDVSSMAQRINSALAGQTKALKEYGISLDSNSLQQTLYQNNIKRTVASLNSAEKAELIYAQIMKQTAGQQGYLAKTMLSPANAANIVRTQFTLLGRSIGNLVLPILMKLLPVVVALTQALTRMATALASFFGIKIDFSDYSADIGNISAGIDGIGDSADGTSKKLKNMLRDFDDLHVVDFGDDSGAGGSAGGSIGGGAGGLGLDVQQYADWSKYLEGVTDKLSQAEGIISAIDGLLAGLTIGGIVGKVLELIGVLDKGKGKALALSTALLGLGIKISFDAQKDILNNGLNADNIVKTILGSITAGAGTYFTAILLGANPGLALTLALTVTLVLAAINFLTPIAEKIQGYTLNHFGGYGKAVGQRYSESMAEGIEINGRKVPIKINQMLINTNEVAQSNLVNLETNVTGTSSRLVNRLNTDFSQIETTINTSTENSKDTAIKAFDSMNKKINDDGISMNESVKNNFNSIRNIVNQSTSGSSQDAQKNFSAINGYADSYFKDTRYKIEGGITGAEKTFTTSIGGMTKNMNSAKTLITDSSKTMADSLQANLANGSNQFKNLSKDSKTYSDEIKSNLEGVGKAKIRMPHFTWSSTPASGWIAKTLSALGLPTSLPKLKVDWYADGGFPDKGDLFIANEREPELIGTMGNKTTVANSVQIIEGIAQASYNGMKRALQEVDFGGGDTLVYVGNKQLTDVVTKQQRMNNKKYGR